MKDSGGPAFPVKTAMFDCTQPGMTLRDYFAAKAMQALLQAGFQSLAKAYQHDTDAVNPIIAKAAYEVADAMIRESKKT